MIGSRFLILCAYITFFPFISRPMKAENLADAENLHSDIFTNYDKDIYPVFGRTLLVHVGMYLFSIVDFDEKGGTLTIMGGLYYFWTDSRLSWIPSQYGNLTDIVVPSNKVWVPDIYYLNPADNMVPIGKKYFSNRIFSNGKIFRNAGSIMKTTCDVDITYFPFDKQTCEIDFYTFGYYSREVYIQILTKQVAMTYFRQNAQWDVQTAKLKPHDKVEFNGTITAVLVLKRHPEYFTVNIMIPVLFLCLLNPVVFLLPAESGERISYAVTIFLSLAVFMTIVNDNMPKSSKPMSRLSMFLIMMIGSSTMFCILAIINTKVYFRDDSLPVPDWSTKFLYFMKMKWFSKVIKKNKDEASSDTDIDEGTSQVIVDNDISYPRKEILYLNENLQDDNSHSNKEKRKIVVDQGMEKVSWKELANEMDQVTFVYSVFILIVTCIIFIVAVFL